MTKTQKGYVRQKAIVDTLDEVLRKIGSSKDTAQAYSRVETMRNSSVAMLGWHTAAMKNENKAMNDKRKAKKEGN